MLHVVRLYLGKLIMINEPSNGYIGTMVEWGKGNTVPVNSGRRRRVNLKWNWEAKRRKYLIRGKQWRSQTE